MRGNAVQGFYNIFLAAISEKEENLRKIEKHYEIQEQERKMRLKIKRTDELQKFEVSTIGIELDQMSEEVYQELLKNSKLGYKAKKEAEKKAEEERLKKEKEEKEEQDRIRKENEKLKKEREEREKLEVEKLKKEQEESQRELERLKKIEEDEKAKKNEEYKKWLSSNNYNVETDKVERDGNKFILYRFISEIEL